MTWLYDFVAFAQQKTCFSLFCEFPFMWKSFLPDWKCVTEGWSLQAGRASTWSTFQSHTHIHTLTEILPLMFMQFANRKGLFCGLSEGSYTTVWLAFHQIVCDFYRSRCCEDEGWIEVWVRYISSTNTIMSWLWFLEMCDLILSLTEAHLDSAHIPWSLCMIYCTIYSITVNASMYNDVNIQDKGQTHLCVSYTLYHLI